MIATPRLEEGELDDVVSRYKTMKPRLDTSHDEYLRELNLLIQLLLRFRSNGLPVYHFRPPDELVNLVNNAEARLRDVSK